MEDIFESLSKGKDYMTFSDLKEWEIIKEMEASGDMDDKLLKEILKTAGWLFHFSPAFLFRFALFCYFCLFGKSIKIFSFSSPFPYSYSHLYSHFYSHSYSYSHS